MRGSAHKRVMFLVAALMGLVLISLATVQSKMALVCVMEKAPDTLVCVFAVCMCVRMTESYVAAEIELRAGPNKCAQPHGPISPEL